MVRKAWEIISRVLGKWRLHYHVYLSLLAILIGILAAYGALLFRFAIKFTQYCFYQDARDILAFADTLPTYLIIALPALGGLLVGPIIYFGAREAKGHGVPEVMEAVALRGGRIRPRVALIKILASGISIGSGGSVGREGPIVQIGSSIGSTLAQILKVPHFRQRTLVGCGAAAGIAATFNAPIAGVLFAVEVLLGDFGLTTFSPVVLSSVTATTISRYYLGDFPAFIIPSYKVVSLWEFLFYPLLGIAAGFAALLFISSLYKCEDLFEALKIPEYLKPALGGLFLGCILWRWPHVFGVGYGSINLSLENQLPLLLLFTLIFVKIVATSITLGSGESGGIFAPSLFIGAMAGGSFGYIVHGLFPLITASSGAYALVGMGALVAGTTHAPITAILIIFELTGSYKIILPLMISCIVSTIITTSLKRGSIYTIKLSRRGVDIAYGWEQSILQALKVRDIMNDQVVTIPEQMQLVDVINTLKNKDVSYLHVIDDTGALTGIISFRDIRPVLQEETVKRLIIARDVATTDVVTIRPFDNIQLALREMGGRGISQLPVVAESDNRKVIGTVSKRDVLAAYDKAVVNREIEIY
ncbi:MAG: chloride channel protein [Deltaproteobacteria bacterium]|nr:MAG: chloride channel protein [Deltaproteobacteria bacterium]